MAHGTHTYEADDKQSHAHPNSRSRPNGVVYSPKMILHHRGRSFLLLSSAVITTLVLMLWTFSGSRPASTLASVNTVPKMPEARVTDWEYQRALQYEGTGARLQAFLEKAKSGKPFTVSVIGGSVSKGRGLRRWHEGKWLPAPPRRRGRGAPGRRGKGPGQDRANNQDFGFGAPAPAPVPAPGPMGRKGGRKRDDEDDDIYPGPGGVGGIGIPVGHGPLGAEHLHPDGNPHFGAKTLYSPENMHVQIFNWLNATWPHADNRFVNGAQGGVGSGYFGWCFKEHIPEDSDLVLVELGINDLVELDGFETYEMLVRRLLELKSRPAIINIEVFTTLFPTLLSSSSLHTDVAAFYDIPSISIRDVLLPRIIEQPDLELPKWFRTGPNVFAGDPKVKEFGGTLVDLMHISAMGHGLAANLVIRHLEEQLRYSLVSPSSFFRRRKSPSAGGKDGGNGVPPAVLTSHFDLLNSAQPQNAVCRTMNSPNFHPTILSKGVEGDKVHGIIPAEGSHGWEKFHFKEKKYLVARVPGAKFVYHFKLAPEEVHDRIHERDAELADNLRQNLAKNTAITTTGVGIPTPHPKNTGPRRQGMARGGHGTVSLGYQRSKILGFGAVLCWVDERKIEAKVIDGWWDIGERNMGRVAEVARDLAPGPHTLHCELLNTTHDDDGRTEFRIFAVMHN